MFAVCYNQFFFFAFSPSIDMQIQNYINMYNSVAFNLNIKTKQNKGPEINSMLSSIKSNLESEKNHAILKFYRFGESDKHL